MTWFFWMKNTGRLTEEEMKCIERFICLDRWTSLVDIVFILKAEYRVAINREFRDLLTEKEGSIMNPRVLIHYNKAVDEAKSYLTSRFKYLEIIDTTYSSLVEAGETITRKTLDILEASFDEEVLSIPKQSFNRLISSQGFIKFENRDAKVLSDLINLEGKFIRRSNVEKSDDYVQIIPFGVLEYDNKVLLLRRKEPDSSNMLNEKYVIWAGGHVRIQDKCNDTLKKGLLREIAEELFVKSQYSVDGPIGLVYSPTNTRAKKHAGILFKIDLEVEDVALGLDQTEFKERRGKSVSGTFLPQSKLIEYYSKMEAWSQLILRDYYKIIPKSADLFDT